ncbi:NUDIX hydrolase [bacterium]|nr:NUDIX hydrolase [bacterium]
MDTLEKTYLNNYDISNYDRPSVTVDVAAFAIQSEKGESHRHDSEPTLSLLLIKRDDYPFKHKWALPGGFLQKYEHVRNCALRNVFSKTSVQPTAMMPIGTFCNPGRDPRGWIISNAYVSILNELPEASESADWFNISYENSNSNNRLTVHLTNDETDICITANAVETKFGITSYEIENYLEELAFDHAEIIIAAIEQLRRIANNFEMIFDFLPETFTIANIQRITEAITGEKQVPANFRRKITPYVTETDDYSTGAGHRPAKLFKRKIND